MREAGFESGGPGPVFERDSIVAAPSAATHHQLAHLRMPQGGLHDARRQFAAPLESPQVVCARRTPVLLAGDVGGVPRVKEIERENAAACARKLT